MQDYTRAIAEAKALTSLLISKGYITEDHAQQTVEEITSTGANVIEYLTACNFATEYQIVESLAEQAGFPFVKLANVEINRMAAELTNEQFCRARNVCPIDVQGNAITYAVMLKDVRNFELREDLVRRSGGHQASFVVAIKSDIIRSINDTYRVDRELARVGQTAEAQEADVVISLENVKEVVEESEVSRFVDLMIRQAIIDRSSDIHVECHEKYLKVRYSIDGVLKEVTRSPISLAPEVLSRIKILSGMDISERSRPQDGRLTVNRGSSKTDIRVASFPGIFGENITMRILDNSQTSYRLTDLGFSEHNLRRFESAYRKPSGMVLVSGPTGSGKSTTMVATLNDVNKPEINILTIEDPVEYRLEGIKQSEVNRAQGYDFPAALKTFLRHAPNIIFVGEIRDTETATIAIRAGMTGHMVYSTIHTQSAAEVITRLSDMGVEPHLINSTLTASLAQRLLRQLCSSCKEQYVPDGEDLLAAQYPWEEGDPIPTLYRAHDGGCKQCSHTGYRGRIGVHEVLLMDDEIKHAVIEGKKAIEIDALARQRGMTTMRDDAWEKVGSGLTDIKEVLRTLV